MKRRVLFAMLTSGLVGACFGGVEAVAQLLIFPDAIPLSIRLAVVSLSMAIYGSVSALLGIAWAVLARRADARAFRRHVAQLSAFAAWASRPCR